MAHHAPDFGLFDDDHHTTHPGNNDKILLASLIAVHAAAQENEKKRSADDMFETSLFMAEDESLSSAPVSSGWDQPQQHEQLKLEPLFNHDFSDDLSRSTFDKEEKNKPLDSDNEGEEDIPYDDVDEEDDSDSDSDDYACDEEQKVDGANILRMLETKRIRTEAVDLNTPPAAVGAGGKRKRIRPSRARNMVLLEESIQAIEGCAKIGMPMIATMAQCNTIYFTVVFTEIKLARIKGEVNVFTLHIPRFNASGKDIRTLLVHRYSGKDKDPRIAFEHWTSKTGHDMYRFTCSMTTHLNVYIPSQVRNVGTNGGQGGYMPEICFRYNCSKGKGSKAPMDMSMVVHMPEQESIDRFCLRQQLALDACTQQRHVLLEFNGPNLKVLLRGMMLSCVLIEHLFTFQLRADDRDNCSFKIDNQVDAQTANSDIIKVASNYVFTVESSSMLNHTDTTGKVLALFRCVLSYNGGENKVPVLVQVSFYDTPQARILHRPLTSSGVKKQKKSSK